LGDKNKPALWPSESRKAYLIPTWLMREQRLAQVINQSISNQSINNQSIRPMLDAD